MYKIFYLSEIWYRLDCCEIKFRFDVWILLLFFFDRWFISEINIVEFKNKCNYFMMKCICYNFIVMYVFVGY